MTTTEETETTETVTSEDVRALARDDVSGDVTRSVAERGGYDVSSDCTSGAGTGSSKQTTETSEKTETFCRGYHYGNVHRDDHDGGNGNDGDSDERDVRALPRDDVRGDVTRSVAERGGYAVSSDCTSGAGTGSSKQTTETTEETETFCRGYHYGNGHRDDHDGGNENDGDSDERGRESLGTRRLWLNAVLSRVPLRNGHRDDHDGGNGNDGDTLARDDVSGDVTRSVAERGGYDVSSDCTSGAGTGSSKQTTETSEETETFCRGYHYGNVHRDDHDGGNGNDGDSDERDVRALPRDDVSGDVTRIVAERGGYAQTTETTEETETFCRGYHYGNGHRDDHDGGNGNDGDTLARDDVSGDVTRSVAERGGYDVSSDCTSGAGTGSSKQTTETTEETETFCRGYHYGNGHRDDHDGGNGNDGDTLAREDVSGDVARSVAERGGYAQTTETSEKTEPFCRGYHYGNVHRDDHDGGNGNDGDTLPRDDVSGDVTRSVAERGGYAVSSDCTSGAGTGSSKQTTETSEETETFCRGYHYGNGHRDDHDGGNGNDGDTLARDDVSGDVTRSVAERGGYDVSSDYTSGAGTGSSKQTTETTEETETFCRGYHYGNGHRDDHDGGNGNDGDTLAREDVSGDVTRSVAERGGYDVSSDCTSGAGTGSSKQTTETTEETETFCRGYHYGNGHRDDHDGGNGNDGDTLAREDVSGDVTRSVAERGGYAVSSDCTSGAGTGSSKQTTETSEKTETFCRGYHYGNVHRDDHDGGNGNDGDTLAREDVSGDVTRSVAERGGYAVSSDCTSGAGTGSEQADNRDVREDGDVLSRVPLRKMSTEMTTTEETETTETVTSEDVRALARDDVSGDVTRSVAERGGYECHLTVRQTTETTKETETFCRGYHYGNGHRDDHDGGNGNDGDTLAREDVSGDVARSVAERGGYAWRGYGIEQADNRDVRETETFCRGYHYGNGHRDDHDGGNKTTETVTSEDVRALARDDVSGDVTRSVAERGGYDVSSDFTSDAGTGSSKQTTETTEETETFCRGYHYGNGHRDDHDGGNGNDGDTLAREDVSGDVARSVAERGGYAWRGYGIEQADNRDVRETETFCRGYHYGNGHRDDHDEETKRRRQALARDDVSGDVTRSVAERGGYDVSSDCTSGAGTGSSKQTTETTEETETFCRGYHYGNGHRDVHDGGNGNDGDTLAREDVSGDVTRSVAERGGYDVSSDCTSGAGTGSSKPTTETTEETETFCRGYHYGNGHRDDHDGGNGNERRQALAREDVSGDVARSVAERGGYAQTTETSEETETFCRGYHYGNGHRDDTTGKRKRRRQ
ncbi:hypothetical protein PInf_020434 [Phytophthora infestans]|nr:hypothetical protein PInf_020434 [Phytophthora infestans]